MSTNHVVRSLIVLLLLSVAVVVASYLGEAVLDPGEPAIQQPGGSASSDAPGEARILRAFRERSSDQWVESEGIVERLLDDDDVGSRHQRFILRLPSGHTLLVSHNIDLAPRVSDLQVGDRVAFRGEYEWNAKGGVIHWTHHDPAGRQPGGWLQHQGRRYD